MLFNIYAERIMQYVLEKWDNSITIGGRKFTTIIYAEENILLSGKKYNLTDLII